MKFLFDFDGVLTNQTEEAQRVRAIFASELVSLSGNSPGQPDQIEQLFQQAESTMAEHPERHGWISKGRVTAFADEDLFIRTNGLAACLDLWAYEGRTELRALQAAIRAHGYEDFFALAQHSYQAMVSETQSGKMKPMDTEAGPLFRRLLERGHQAVVVSNSGSDRILNLFEKAGIAAVAQSDLPSHELFIASQVRVRGGAQKFELGESTKTFDVGKYRVEVARPLYETILRDEKPQVVIGDVFSLDLALPLYLARTEPLSFGGVHLFLRTQPYTPDWSRLFVRSSQEANAYLHLLDNLPELFDFLDKN